MTEPICPTCKEPIKPTNKTEGPEHYGCWNDRWHAEDELQGEYY